jgi:hypothetical protein
LRTLPASAIITHLWHPGLTLFHLPLASLTPIEVRHLLLRTLLTFGSSFLPARHLPHWLTLLRCLTLLSLLLGLLTTRVHLVHHLLTPSILLLTHLLHRLTAILTLLRLRTSLLLTLLPSAAHLLSFLTLWTLLTLPSAPRLTLLRSRPLLSLWRCGLVLWPLSLRLTSTAIASTIASALALAEAIACSG